MRKILCLLCLVVAIATIGATSARAGVTYVLNEAPDFTANDLVGSINNVTPPVSFNGNVYIGQLDMAVTPSVGSVFDQEVFCSDIFNDYGSGGTFALSTTSLVSRLGGVRAEQIAAILVNAPILSADQSAAAQLAIWEIENETDGHYNITKGNFTGSTNTDNTAVTALANQWLDYVGNNTWTSGGATVDEFVPTNPLNNQSFVFLDQGGGISGNPIPEPGTIALLGSGLVALGLVRRRRLR